MKQKTMILIVLAVVCGLGASFMTSKLLADRKSDEEMVKVLVAKKNLDSGMIMKKPEDLMEEKEVAKETAPKNALSRFDEVKGRQLKIPRRQGDTITQDDLHDDKTLTLSGMLPPGHRAVGIRVSSEQTASGFAAVPHSRIDIACSVRCNNDRDCGSRIILQNVLVLASGQVTIREENGKAMPCDVVTVALVPEDALKLEASKNKGSLTMFLRPFGESSRVKTGVVTWESVTHNRPGDMSDEESEETKKPSPGAAPGNLDNLVLNTSSAPTPAPTFQRPADEKFVQRITNEKTVRVVYTRDADGQYESRTEVTDPNSTSVAPPARSSQRSNVTAPAPTTTPKPVPSPSK